LKQYLVLSKKDRRTEGEERVKEAVSNKRGGVGGANTVCTNQHEQQSLQSNNANAKTKTKNKTKNKRTNKQKKTEHKNKKCTTNA